MEEDGSKVFNHEDCPPSNLGAEVLDENFSGGKHIGFIGNRGFAVFQSLLGGRVENANTVEVPNLGFFGDEGLEVVDGGIGGQVDRCGKSLDGLLG